MDDQPKKRSKILYGKIAEQYKDTILADHIRDLTRRKKDDDKKEKKSPRIVSDPQGLIIQGRLRRFKPTITSYAKNFCLGLISRDDFLIATRNDTRKFLNSVSSMGRLFIPPEQVNHMVNEVVDTLYQMTEELTPRDMDIHMVPPIVDTIMGIIEKKFAERSEISDHEKFAEAKEGGSPLPANDPLSEFPPEIQKLLLSRLPMLGLNPRDIPTLKRLARQMGVDPDEAIAEMKAGRIPDKLKNFL